MWPKRLLIAGLLFFAAHQLAAQTPPTLQEIKTSLICLCECNMTVEACEGAMACDSSEKMTAEARQLIAKGLDKKQVLAAFVGRYGEHILAAPSKKGFNLTAWITPFAAILVAGFGITRIVRKWSHRQGEAQEKPRPASTEYEKLLDEVLRKLD